MIKRSLLTELISHLDKKEISLIVGSRQVGKTTLMYLLRDYLVQNRTASIYLSLDNESDKEFFLSQEKLIRKIELELGKNKGIVFIDEIQRKENAGLFLKGIYDLNLPYKFIVSGSGSLELKEKIHESLAGRKRIFELGPVTFEEFVNFKTEYRYQKKLGDFFSLENEKVENLLSEYLNYGGYPRVILEDKIAEKRRVIDEIVRSYLEKDISCLLKVDKLDSFSTLLKMLAAQTGRLVNYSELSASAGISLPTVKNYLWYAEKTFTISRLPPYFKNTRSEITKSPSVYFSDLGLRNYLLGIFGTISQPRDAGFIFQNLIFNILKNRLEHNSASLRFWRTKDRAEVDFVIDSGKAILPIEVKFQKLKQPEFGRSLRSFVEKYRPAEAWVVNLSLDTVRLMEKTNIVFIPFWKLADKVQDVLTA